MIRVLIIEDDPKTADMIALYLHNEGYDVVKALSGREGLNLAIELAFDLIILDIMLPETDGLEICREIREFSIIPIIMLTAMVNEADKISGLEKGADDYVTKPFSPSELIARVNALLRRKVWTSDPSVSQLHLGVLVIDFFKRRVLKEGVEVELTPIEFNLLKTLSSAPGRVFSRAQLVQLAIGDDFLGIDRNVDTHITNLRRKIEQDRSKPCLIKTVFGLGYRFSSSDD